MEGFVAEIGEGLALTKAGNLRLADGRAIAERLGLADLARAEELDLKIRTTADLTDLDLTFRVARAAGLVKVRHGRVSPTRRAADLRTAPHRSWPRVVDGLLDVGILAHRYRRQQYLVPPWVDQLDHSVEPMLLLLYVAGDPVPIEELVDLARQDLDQVWQIPGPGDEPDAAGQSFWWEVPERNVRELLRRLAQAGVLEVADVEHEARKHGIVVERGGTALLTPAGRTVAAELARRAGAEVADAGRLRDAAPRELLHALGQIDWQEGEAELQIRADARGMVTALGELVDAVHQGLPIALVPAATSAVITCADAVEVEAAAPHLRRLLAHRLLGPVVGGWLLGHGVGDVPVGNAVDGLVSLAAVGAPDERW